MQKIQALSIDTLISEGPTASQNSSKVSQSPLPSQTQAAPPLCYIKLLGLQTVYTVC